MTYQSAYLNLELTKESTPKKAYNFTLELELKALIGHLIIVFFSTPELKRDVGPAQTKQITGRNLGQYLF
jgi:hypothetical protein